MVMVVWVRRLLCQACAKIVGESSWNPTNVCLELILLQWYLRPSRKAITNGWYILTCDGTDSDLAQPEDFIFSWLLGALWSSKWELGEEAGVVEILDVFEKI